MRRPVSRTGCVMLPMEYALEVQKETGYEEA
jgi:hypothetical protein